MYKKRIQELKILRYAETGLPMDYSSGEITFCWDDWVICGVSFRPGNPVHQAICSGFRCESFGGEPGDTAKNVVVNLWNPTYEEPHTERYRLNSLHVWKPLFVIPSITDMLTFFIFELKQEEVEG